ncbi:dihydroxy-acid dehydratase [Pelosinus propionicus]|uniref:Dihydroxy-acid dehydratase n=1 Tax=Pelosinus propionicus DSM 13327 TaxID=1123291 RepID=A0A1I4PRR5_9FIRM|nr:dihydroxy-acid dehydratase [Pelosinus propionicus]SFM30394.1 dihydroxy-acid dehydratase [Pelosinus propionicus DSM 13327]
MERAIDRLEPYQRAIAKVHLASAGIALDALDGKPLVAIANSWNEVCPGHEPLLKLAEAAKAGIRAAGGEPIEFNTIGMCDGISQGHLGMRYTLPHRDMIADSVEVMVLGHGIFDGIVLLGSCDKIIPGMMQAALRINLPAVIVTAGASVPECKPSDSKQLRTKFLAGEITEREMIEGSLQYYSGPGVCPFFGTANTMAVLCEAMGLMLSGSSVLPAPTSVRRFSAEQSGRAVMDMIKQGIRPRDIATTDAFYNGLVVLNALGGSLNAFLHLPAIAAEAGIPLSWDSFEEVSDKTPLLAALVPNGNQTVYDLYRAGGLPSVLKELQSLLKIEAGTVDGISIGEVARNASKGDRDVIKAFDKPLAPTGGVQVLYGSMAPCGALVKASAVPKEQHLFSGPAIVFESEEACHTALHENKIKSGQVVVVRYEGPKGGPGMRELHRVTEVLKGVPNTALITDGRFSGASAGLSIGYLCPEAAEGGPIALVEDGDTITISLTDGIVNLNVDPAELERRRLNWQPLVKETGSNLLLRYSKQVGPTVKGAIWGL